MNDSFSSTLALSTNETQDQQILSLVLCLSIVFTGVVTSNALFMLLEN